MSDQQIHDPLNFMRNMWGNMGFTLPGMVAPTFDVEELDKRIKDMKAVEGWLRMNLSMLQMTIQGLEMQRTTVSTVQTMGKMASDAAKAMEHGAAPEAAAPQDFLRGAVNPENEPKFDAWQTTKGLLVAGSLLVIFLFTDLPRDVAALVGAGILLLSRRFHSSEVMGFIDWELLVLFIGLFVVNHAFQQTGLASVAVAWLGEHGIRLGDSGPLFVVGVTLSNLVSNVPATMLLLPHLSGERAGVTLALVSTLAGNLLLVGSIANLIVCDLARKEGISIDWRQHAVIGLPVTLMTLAIVWFWLV